VGVLTRVLDMGRRSSPTEAPFDAPVWHAKPPMAAPACFLPIKKRDVLLF